MDLNAIILGVGAGVTLATTGFAKSENETMDWGKFGATVVLGALVGLGGSLLGIDLPVLYSYGIDMGAIAALENALKALYRKIIKPWIFKK